MAVGKLAAQIAAKGTGGGGGKGGGARGTDVDEREGLSSKGGVGPA